MFNVTNKSCPYGNWTSVARTFCDNPDHFHCLKDEYGRLGWVCAEPMWVEKGRCPVFNVVAEKLDTTECPTEKCPPYNYRSNAIDVEYACRYTISSVSSSSTTVPVSTNIYNLEPHINLLTIFIIVLAIIAFAVVIIFIYIRHLKNSGTPQQESVSLIPEDTEKGFESNDSFKRAKNYLEDKKRVVISGVQGTGKTYLAKSLVDNLEKKNEKSKKLWISNLQQMCTEQEKPTKNVDVYIFDEIFYEIQLESEFIETLNVLINFMQTFEEVPVIVTIPSYIWEKYNELFRVAGLDAEHIDLNKINVSEKRSILKQLMAQHQINAEKAEDLCKSENILLGTTPFKTVGFPAVVSWICKTSSEERIDSLLRHSLKKMKEEIEDLKNSHRVEECGKYVILSYMTFCNGVLDLRNVNTSLLSSFKNMYAPGFEEKNMKQYADGMVGQYLSNMKTDLYKIDSNIVKKLVFVIVTDEHMLFAQNSSKKVYYSRHTIKEEDCPEKMDEVYPECFIKIRCVKDKHVFEKVDETE